MKIRQVMRLVDAYAQEAAKNREYDNRDNVAEAREEVVEALRSLIDSRNNVQDPPHRKDAMNITWTQFTKRTEDPKLAYLEHLLTLGGIPHKRDGASFHAPIMMVPEHRLDDANAVLARKVNADLDLEIEQEGSLDDLADDHKAFYLPDFDSEQFEDCAVWWIEHPSDFIPTCNEDDPCGECQECLGAQDEDDTPQGMGWVGYDGRP